MIFFSGFSLKDEKKLFEEFLEENDFTVAGFSYGAIKAFEYTLNTQNRVDKLQLLSPAFFQNKEEKFKKLQLLYYRKDKQAYEKNFLKNIAYPLCIDMTKHEKEDNIESLKELLYYQWNEEQLLQLVNNGVHIEVYLGKHDKIIDAETAKEFFKKYATVYFLNHAGHILR